QGRRPPDQRDVPGGVLSPSGGHPSNRSAGVAWPPGRLREPGVVDRLAAAIAAIDAANAEDPNVIVVDGVGRPKEQAHAEMMTEWVRRLDPDCSEEQLLAARAHHLRRWTVPRDAYPEGRSGYLRWRTALKQQHAEDVAAILRRVGDGGESAERVQRVIREQGLGREPAAPGQR